MQWEKAKNYILISFILLNILLGGLIFLESRRYTMTSDRVRNINFVLGQNNISLYSNLMQQRFTPMRSLDVSGFYYDVDELINFFFDEPELVTQPNPDRQVFRHGNSELQISGGLVSFDFNVYGLGQGGEISREEAARITNAFVNEHFPTFVPDITFERDNGVRLVYREEYNGRVVYLNFIEFFVTEFGIEWIEKQRGQILGYSTAPRNIFAPDEALLTFIQYAREIDEPIIITRLEMVYFQEYEGLQSGTFYPAIPAYRIFIEGNEESTYLINAFTNRMIN